MPLPLRARLSPFGLFCPSSFVALDFFGLCLLCRLVAASGLGALFCPFFCQSHPICYYVVGGWTLVRRAFWFFRRTADETLIAPSRPDRVSVSCLFSS